MMHLCLNPKSDIQAITRWLLLSSAEGDISAIRVDLPVDDGARLQS